MTVLLLDSDASVLFEAPNQTGTPERNLLMAVLERAVLDYVGNDPKEVEAATYWLFGEGAQLSSEAPPQQFSFPWICQQLDLEEDKIAEKIRQMPKRGDRRVAPWYFKNAS